MSGPQEADRPVTAAMRVIGDGTVHAGRDLLKNRFHEANRGLGHDQLLVRADR